MIAIAIDGPGGAGKSTVARELSQKLGYIYVDTGALYRAIGLHAKRNNAKNESDIMCLLKNTKLELRWVNDIQRVFLNEEDVSETIRLPEISMAASNVSAMPQIRTFLLNLQRNMADENNVIMDGRDIGTVILPNAQVKIFLTALPEERAKRRCRELLEKGLEADYNQVLTELKQRDYQDTNRTTAPLKQAQDAILLDTTGLTLQETIALIERMVKEKIIDVL